MPNCCSQKLLKQIIKNEAEIKQEVTSSIKKLSDIKDQYPNLYIVLRILPLEEPTRTNLYKYADLYPFFIKSCQERSDNFHNYISFTADKDQVPKSTINKLLSMKVPKTFRLRAPSPICKLNLNTHDLIEKVFENNQLLKKYKQQIKIINSEINSTRFFPKSNSFKITFNKHDCANHRFFSLLHELGHVHYMLTCFKKNIDPRTMGKYKNEQAAIKFTLSTIKLLIPNSYQVYVNELKNSLKITVFELNLYKNLPAKPVTIFEYKSLKSPYLFLYYKNNAFKPLCSLAESAAFVNIIHP